MADQSQSKIVLKLAITSTAVIVFLTLLAVNSTFSSPEEWQRIHNLHRNWTRSALVTGAYGMCCVSVVM
jgi:hypothetical protein